MITSLPVGSIGNRRREIETISARWHRNTRGRDP